MREGRLTPEQAEAHPQRAIVDARARCRRRGRGRHVRDLGRGRRPRAALLRRPHDDGARARYRALRTQRTRPAARSPICSSPPPTRQVARTTSPSSSSTCSRSTPPSRGRHVGPARLNPRRRSRPRRRFRRPPSRVSRSRLRTVRGVLLVVLPLVVILGVAAGVLGWYAAQLVLRRRVEQRGRDLQGRARRRARLGPHRRPAHRHPGRHLPPLDQDRVQTNSTRGSLSTAQTTSDGSKSLRRRRRRPPPPSRSRRPRPRPRRRATTTTRPRP